MAQIEKTSKPVEQVGANTETLQSKSLEEEPPLASRLPESDASEPAPIVVHDKPAQEGGSMSVSGTVLGSQYNF
jgi:hypothetical protein